jgi:hypothetical protein
MQMLSQYIEGKDEWVIQGLEFTGNILKNTPLDQEEQEAQL